MAGELGFRPEAPHIEEVAATLRVRNEKPADEKGSSRRHRDPRHHDTRHPKEYMHAISKAAEASNKQLEKTKAPYRFCVYEEDGKVLIDLVMLDQSGKIIKEVKRNVTDEDFNKVIEDISAIEGLFFDSTG